MTGRDLIAEVDAVFADIEFALDRLAKVTGDNRARHAAHVLRGRKGGRPPIDDAQALAEIDRMVSAGKQLRTALSVIARRSPLASAHATAQRLRRKYREKSARNGFCASRDVVNYRHDPSQPHPSSR